MSELSYKEYKTRRKSVQDTLQEIAQAPKGKKEYPVDEKMFKYQKDKAGNAFIQLRFLPSRNSHPPMVDRKEHYFENVVGKNKRTYWDNCPTSIGKECPICADNRIQWKAGNEDLARKRARKDKWFANVFIIKDSNNPDNNGKVFVWKFPKQVYEKIMSAMQPSDEDIEAGKKPVDVFDLETGADFILKVKTSPYVNYEGSYFAQARPLFDNDKAIEEVFNKIHDLKEYVDPSVYKSYDELKERFDYVLGCSGGKKEVDEDTDEPEAESPKAAPKREPVKAAAAPAKKEDTEEEPNDDEVDAYFGQLEDKKK